MVVVAAADGTVSLGTPSDFCSVVLASSFVVSSLAGSPSSDLGAAVSTSPVTIETTPATTQPAVPLLSHRSPRSEPDLVAPPFNYYRTCSVSFHNFFFLVAALLASSADIDPAAQPLSSVLTAPKGLAIQILRDRLTCLKREPSCLDEAFNEREAHLESLQLQIADLVSFQDAPQSEIDAVCCELESMMRKSSHYFKW